MTPRKCLSIRTSPVGDKIKMDCIMAVMMIDNDDDVMKHEKSNEVRLGRGSALACPSPQHVDEAPTPGQEAMTRIRSLFHL